MQELFGSNLKQDEVKKQGKHQYCANSCNERYFVVEEKI